METTPKFNNEQTKKIAFIQEKTQQTSDQIIADALDFYYQKLCNENEVNQPKNNLEKFSEIGFIGCIDAEPDLAENSESILNQEMKENS